MKKRRESVVTFTAIWEQEYEAMHARYDAQRAQRALDRLAIIVPAQVEETLCVNS